MPKKKIPMFIPNKFAQKYAQLLGDEYPLFLDFCKKKLPRAVRANSLKISADKLCARLKIRDIELKPHSAFRDVFMVKAPGVQLGRLPEHMDGLFVVQEVSSMIPPRVLNPRPGETVLDLAAAPGMKTAQMAEMMQNKGAIVAVDISIKRLKALWFNLNRLGVINALVVNRDARRFFSKTLFDRVLLDAPCSSEGLVRKKPDCLKGWHPRLVEKKSVLQKHLIQRAFSLLKPNGTLVYSTCTLSPEENEGVIDFLLSQNKTAQIQKIKILHFKFRSGLGVYKKQKFDSSVADTVRVLPQDNDSEAFFIAKITKRA